jgi:beta-galactosidase
MGKTGNIHVTWSASVLLIVCMLFSLSGEAAEAKGKASPGHVRFPPYGRVQGGVSPQARRTKPSLPLHIQSHPSQGRELNAVRTNILLKSNWFSIADDKNSNAYNGFEKAKYKPTNWQSVTVPHNWDKYEGYRRLKHGNRHGYAWYRTNFNINQAIAGKRVFLFFEGVGSYATVWLNGKKVGYHAGGRTTFTLDVTDAIKPNQQNLLAVRADHPASIQDLPWVCGGCSDEVGFSEGSQPMGIFRPVHVIVTNPVRIEPFGVHIWNDTTVSEKSAVLNMQTEVKNYSARDKNITIVNTLLDASGKTVKQVQVSQVIASETDITIPQTVSLSSAHLWSLEHPYLYKLVTEIKENGKVTDRTITPYGIRWISWPVGRAGNNKQFLLNGKPAFINGIAEYEHQMGNSHAFTDAEIHSRVMQVKATGFNAFRDAHQPHNLAYQNYWDELGILWWPQFTAHIWYDSPAFRENFKVLLTDWVKERRNNPSNILWGLQNESKLPETFAKECSDIIRKLDPTASSQRKITTCNGGTGTDWDVPQNWTGTYGGDPQTYAADLQKQVLVGEYGAWRTTDLHTEGPFAANAPLSENRMTQLMETKIRLAETVKDKTTGHFMWLLQSHENPGRTQSGEGLRELDRVGPINYKGLLTPWGEPTDAYYFYRANFAPKATEPTVYIVSHTWPDRWLSPGIKDSITVYSNCDEVELFNDVNGASLGKKQQQGIGTHFQWDKVNIQYNVLYAVGYVGGKRVAEDVIVLHHLPLSPNFGKLVGADRNILKQTSGLNYLYRVNCGGPDYTDASGNKWLGDVHQTNSKTWGSTSWTDDFHAMLPMFGSQRRSFDPVKGTNDETIFQTFRYGQEKLQYHFPVPDGDYQIELYFNEPWYGLNNSDAKGWRTFDVAVNGKTVIKDLDIWAEAGYNAALKKTVTAHITGGQLTISFPHVASGEAVISAIAIATKNIAVKPAKRSPNIIENSNAELWMDTGDQPYTDSEITISSLPSNLYGAEWFRTVSSKQQPILQAFKVHTDAEVYIAFDAGVRQKPEWMNLFSDTKTTLQTDAGGGRLFNVYTRHFTAGSTVQLGNNGIAEGKTAQMYIVAALPTALGMEPATDLKPTVSYRIDAAEITGGGLVKEDVAGKKCLTFKAALVGQIEWTITTGVGESHELRIKYFNPTGKKLTGKLKLLAADGTLMKEAVLDFGTNQPDKWKVATTTTGTSINAGNYKLILTAENVEGLSISGAEVQ